MIVALGDSITAAQRSWAHRLARTMGQPLVNHASDGAVVADVLRRQLPRLHERATLGCLYVGVNDARGPRFDADAYERDLAAAAGGLRAHCAQLLMCTMPLDLGRPTAAPKPSIANAAIRRVAGATEAVLCALDDLAGPVLLQPDAVHPTDAGQAEIAERAARALAASG